ncbi:MAG: ABC transporter ATP-binding protein [Lachnospiraceae bacterium]|nr:ABC transporter ATP-binding protein [Lachnospiraceae bacterium]
MLEVKDLKIEFFDHSKPETAVRDVDFTMKEGEIVGLVGESGSGKSLTATAIAGLIRRGDVKVSGEILWDSKNLLKASRRQMRALQGEEIGFVFQDPMTAFSPVHKIGYQVEDALRVHGKSKNAADLNNVASAEGEASENEKKAGKNDKEEYSREELKALAIQALKDAELPDPERVYNSYPFELSGGMRQRAMIASAMISKPRLLIADEPTTALDVTVQAEIIKLLQRINKEDNTAILFISHDLGLVKKLCSKVLVLRNGDVLESGSAEEIFENPKDEYTKKLIAANVVIGKEHGEADENHIIEEPECVVTDYSFYYPARKSFGDLRIGKKAEAEKSRQPEKIGITDIRLTVRKGEIVGLVGESGSGKSTLAKCIVGLQGGKSATGSITCGKARMIFQDTYSALNPKMKVGRLLKEALVLSGIKDKEEQKKEIQKILDEVELSEEFLERFPAELSGGQRQRVGIALALLQKPTLLVADEPVSALDVAISESILALLRKISRKYHMAILFISHDLRTVYHLCDRVCVMKQGRIVEEAEKEELYTNPKEEYTKVLLRSALE